MQTELDRQKAGDVQSMDEYQPSTFTTLKKIMRFTK
jgi:hypothetical protein